MDPVTGVIFAVLLVLGIVLGPFMQLENRPAFFHPERKPHKFVSSMRPSDWDK